MQRFPAFACLSTTLPPHFPEEKKLNDENKINTTAPEQKPNLKLKLQLARKLSLKELAVRPHDYHTPTGKGKTAPIRLASRQQ